MTTQYLSEMTAVKGSLDRRPGGTVEKLLYVIWKRAGESTEELRQALLGPIGSILIERGARSLSVNIADDDAAFASAIRITRRANPISATVSVWLDTHLRRSGIEQALAEVSSRLAGYLVLESVPIVNTKHSAAIGERLPGITTVAFLEKPSAMTYEAWLDRWQGHHTQVAIETQSTYLYIQNVVIRALTPGAPPWTAIVEEAFPAEAATDPMMFYAAAGDEQKLRENQRRMMDSCQTFIDFSTLESHPMSTYVLAR